MDKCIDVVKHIIMTYQKRSIVYYFFFQPVSLIEMAVAVDSARWFLRDTLLKLKKVEEALSLVGIFYLGKISTATAWDLVIGVRTHLWPKLFKRNLTKEYGTWAGMYVCMCVLRLEGMTRIKKIIHL